MEADEGNLSLVDETRVLGVRINEDATDVHDSESNKSHNGGRGLKKFKRIFTKRGQLEKERMEKELRVKTPRLLNDGINSDDHIHRDVYAEAMAETIKMIELPATIGIFGRWGSGKSFFLKMIKDLLEPAPKAKKRRMKCCIRGVSAVVILLIYIICLMWAIKPSMFMPHPIAPLTNSTNYTTVTSNVDENDQRFHVYYYIALAMLVLLGVVVCVVMQARQWCSSDYPEHFHLLCVTAFAKIPKPNPMKLMEHGQQFIFVDFNAWEYAGSDVLWAAIVTKLSCEIEAQFGRVTSRLFRLFQVKYSSSSEVRYEGWFWYCMQHPKTLCHLPTLFWFLACVISFISLPFIVDAAILLINPDMTKVKNPLALKITSWLPATCATTIAVIKFVWAMFHSQRARIHSALAGANSSMSSQLGFMNKVKREVAHIINLLNCAAFCHNRQYRVIISIDDLDRCPMQKIKSVLEAVSILLSDPSAPFVCLIAVDSRIAVKSIEETMGKSLLKSNVTGHEYLKKIINLPFSLPPLDDGSKKMFIENLKQPEIKSCSEVTSFQSFFNPWLCDCK